MKDFSVDIIFYYTVQKFELLNTTKFIGFQRKYIPQN